MTYEDLRNAIEKTVLVRSKNVALIIASESTGAHDPWIFDFRALMLQSHWLDRYTEIFWELYGDLYPFQVGGVETAGIPLVSAIVMKSVERKTPVNGFYMRKSRKRQGLMKFIEGTLTKDPIIFVDDLMNSGQSVAKYVEILASSGYSVSNVFVLLTFRENDAYAFLKDKNILMKRLFQLSDFGIPRISSRAPEVPKAAFETVWRFNAPKPSFHLVVQKSTPAADKKNLYFGCDDGVFRAIRKTDGATVWEFSIGKHPEGKGILSSPSISGDTVYFGAYDGKVYALDTQTGKKRWSYDDADWIGSSPALAPHLNLIYIGLEFGLWRKRGGIAGLDMKTGKLVWSATHQELTHASPLYIPEEELVVIGSNDGVLYAYDANSGAERWRFATRGDIKMRAAYDANHKTILCASMDGSLYAISAKDGMPLHAYETGAGIYGSPVVADDTVYVASLDKCVYAIDLTNWSVRWIFETGGRIFSSPVLADESLWIGSNDGRLYEVELSTGKLRTFFQATERIVSPILVQNKTLYVPTVANEIYCLRRVSS